MKKITSQELIDLVADVDYVVNTFPFEFKVINGGKATVFRCGLAMSEDGINVQYLIEQLAFYRCDGYVDESVALDLQDSDMMIYEDVANMVKEKCGITEDSKIYLYTDKKLYFNGRVDEYPHEWHAEEESETSAVVAPQLNSLPNSIDEARRVLNFLGVNPDDFMEIDNLDGLIRLVSIHEHEIIQDADVSKIDMVKEIFNLADMDIVERKRRLHNLVESWRQ